MSSFIFRAWLKDEERMVNVDVFRVNKSTGLVEFINYEDTFKETDYGSESTFKSMDFCHYRVSLMQSTGIFDVDKKLIYEDDIVEIDNEVYHVTWYSYNACFLLHHIKTGDKGNNLHIGEPYKIIGNIYQDDAEALALKKT